MTGLVGIVGDGSASELRRMAARMDYRGEHIRVWSPAPDVYLAEVSAEPRSGPAQGPLALDCIHRSEESR